MFQHQSLGIKINIQVTKLVLLRQRPVSLCGCLSEHAENLMGLAVSASEGFRETGLFTLLALKMALL